MNDVLQRALDELAVNGRTVNLFFRDDDAATAEATLRKLLHTFSEEQTPLTLAVIPARLTGAGARRLRQAPSSLFELHQHGWQHANHEAQGRKCEFGASRSFAQQRADIAAGKQRMNDAFGAAGWFPAFTPPWNRCTVDTHRALDELGFAVFSKDRGQEAITGYRFRELSITLDLFRWKGEPAMKAPELFCEELATQLRSLDTVGVLLHHQVMDAAAFAFVKQLLGELRQCPNLRLHTLRSLLGVSSPRVSKGCIDGALVKARHA